MKVKNIYLFVVIAALLPVLFSMILAKSAYSIPGQWLKVIQVLWGSSEFSPVLRLSVLINFPLFMTLISLKKDQAAKGVLIGTALIGMYIILLHFF